MMKVSDSGIGGCLCCVSVCVSVRGRFECEKECMCACECVRMCVCIPRELLMMKVSDSRIGSDVQRHVRHRRLKTGHVQFPHAVRSSFLEWVTSVS